ncbi:Methyltransferase domain-containing protein [Amphritea atlantica]|uniref:Methyltransferase domain-containing protein n=1 Tax=Amphritea atlantica TaxID=355243 RepID=A0A1H9JI66_9GAMM|nr:class I SAM-dependent methyltransferase [Amphritea atlantica]SEQ86671.1 Methyltransferase domain-containing protein [Amphritea atlantica]
MSLRRFNPYYRWLFPWLLDRVSKVVAPEREQLLSYATGAVLEIGAGTGTSFDCYPGQVSELYALEPDTGVMQKACAVLAALPEAQRNKIQLLVADAMDIPLADNQFDTVVCFLVLCSVPHPQKVLQEIYRVLRPGGQLLFFEHVLSDDVTVQRWQHRLNPFWRRCAGGCQLNRETAELISRAGFEVPQLQRYQHHAFPRLVKQLVTGIAVKPS